MVKRSFFVLLVVLLAQPSVKLLSQQVFEIQPNTTYVTNESFSSAPGPGDTVKILAPRSERLKFDGLSGDELNPLVFINSGGQVNINTTAWGALEFKDCRFIKVTGSGDPSIRYGFTLLASDCGLAFSNLSSDCEAEYIEVIGGEDTFFGIYAKKDYGGNPPDPYPQFNNLSIHDMYIHGVSEGMYIGETISPGMEFRHVKIYNNIVSDTHREIIQIANCVEDVEINNNLLVNAGLQNLDWQNNILLIGGNSVARVYNNIICDAPGFGIEIFGIGNIEAYNNYCSNNTGVFIDNRYWPEENTPIKVENNFFSDQSGSEVVKNMNEYNDLYVTGNNYNTDIPFFLNASAEPPVLVVENNNLQTVDPLDYSIEDGLFIPDPDNPDEYTDMGPVYPVDQVVARIPISPDQLTDMVAGGSFRSPGKLFDEQYLDPELYQHPISRAWKPASKRKKRNAPFIVELDLGSKYYIEKILLHDYWKKGEFVISYLSADQVWIDIATDPLTGRYVWNEHILNINTRYLRFTMNNWKAYVNEIALYGYALDGRTKSGFIQNKPEKSPVNIIAEAPYTVYPNPATNMVNIDNHGDKCQVEILDLRGKKIIETDNNQISVADLAPGLYIIRIYNRKKQKVQTNQLIISR